MDDRAVIPPEYTPEQREEIGRIDYLLGELRRLCERGMVPPETTTRCWPAGWVCQAERAPASKVTWRPPH